VTAQPLVEVAAHLEVLAQVLPRDLQLVHAAANKGSPLYRRRKIPRIAAEPTIARVEVQKSPVAIPRYGRGIDLDNVRAQSAGSNPHRSAHHAPDAVASDDGARSEVTRARLYDDAVPVVVHRVDAHALANPNTSRGRCPREGVIELDPSNDPSDGARSGGGLSRRTSERDAVDADIRHVHPHADAAKQRVPTSAERTGAGLVAREDRPLQHHHGSSGQPGRRMGDRQSRRRAGGASPHDDDVSVERHVAGLTLNRGDLGRTFAPLPTGGRRAVAVAVLDAIVP
jgi:hypothetical protein